MLHFTCISACTNVNLSRRPVPVSSLTALYVVCLAMNDCGPSGPCDATGQSYDNDSEKARGNAVSRYTSLDCPRRETCARHGITAVKAGRSKKA